MKNMRDFLHLWANISTNFVIKGQTYSFKGLKDFKRLFSGFKKTLNGTEKKQHTIILRTIDSNIKDGLERAKHEYEDLLTKIDILDGIKEVLKSL